MSTEQDLLHKSTLVASDNKSTFEERMERLEKGEVLDAKQGDKKHMTADEVIKMKTGGKRKSQRKRKQKSKRQRKSRRQRKSHK